LLTGEEVVGEEKEPDDEWRILDRNMVMMSLS